MKKGELEANLMSSNVCRVATVSQMSVMRTPYVHRGKGTVNIISPHNLKNSLTGETALDLH